MMPRVVIAFAVCYCISAAVSSKIPPKEFPNSKFLDPQLSDEENLSLLAVSEAELLEDEKPDVLDRSSRQTEEEFSSKQLKNPLPSDGKKFGLLMPMLNMIGLGSGGSYSNQYNNIPGTTAQSTNGYRVPFYNYPFYNYHFFPRLRAQE